MKTGYQHNLRGTRSLLGIIVAIVAIWTVVLPAAAKLPAVRNHLEFLETHRVNAAAMFYTELDPRD